ncbi:MAG: hypothetical protein K6G85_03740 [Eubacterium sp.]|nr:hypothetical protein [Eubacterium sp.]
MKKKILLLVVSVFAMVLMVGCVVKKDVITTDEFIAKAEKNGMKASDVLKKYEGDSTVKEATEAEHDAGWKVEFLKMSSVGDARSLFEKEKKKLEAAAEKGNTTFVDTSDYQTFKATIKKEYYYICCVGDTFLNVHINEKYEEAVKAFCDDIGY